MNVADKATKWNSDPNWDSSDEWFKGPAFLHKNQSEWPQMPQIETIDRSEYRPYLLQINAIENSCKLIETHCITSLVVDDYHRKYHHLNHETALNEIRQKFHISELRVLLKSVRRDCQACKIQNARPQVPEMANLPKARLSAFCRPFTFVGVDFFGPIIVTVGRRNEKRWGALFTCLTIRAVHVEIAHSLTTDSFIMCLRNFMARRGTPLEIYSDNGTNFRGAEKVLKEELKQVDLGRVADEFVIAELKWNFNPPTTPHMGGAWERLVRSIKTVLYKILSSRKVGDESLRCALIEVENIINSRPLTFVSLDVTDDEALTPNHFLLGSSNGLKIPCDPVNLDLRKSWKQSQMLADIFWKKWVKAFLPTLNKRSKWFIKTKPITKGDLVIIVDNDLPRNCWPKGRVVDVVTAKDGQVRRAKVQTEHGVYERPSVKLAVLDIAGREQESKPDTGCSQLTGGGMLATSALSQ
ncbi:uncharacterized protein LOC129952291 [Eupeodes corollae]|uniref:uncharacterized protein LOC129952291 n=1 Tax=Eupeodes corollae TaxID=290404 RepID=UPI0024938834|nr:uncharacterized protein LOC129952291 [Eupeodes corollae]